MANDAFNAQVQALMIAAAAMFVSRFMSVHDSTQIEDRLGGSWFGFLLNQEFLLPGQWLMALSWLIALAVVALPALVKLLPRVPGRGAERTELSVGNYLREFFANDAWPRDKVGRRESERVVAELFADNSFWPTGDNRARVLFFVAFWIFFFKLQPPPLHAGVLLVGFVVFSMLAYISHFALFAALEASLRYVDEMLVTRKGQHAGWRHRSNRRGDRTRDTGVFISYRRLDSAPYARALQYDLLTELDPDRVFMDITDIRPGEDFTARINQALDDVDAVIVMIGPLWLGIEDDHMRKRIENPEDLVHVEIDTAMRRGKSVFPVLVGGATMPAESELPEPLRELSQRNAVELSDTRWAYDVERLVNAVKIR